MEENHFDPSSRKTEVSEGDRIFLYTDGVIEAINPWGETYGRHRLENHFNNINRPEDIFETIRRDLKHSGETFPKAMISPWRKFCPWLTGGGPSVSRWGRRFRVAG